MTKESDATAFHRQHYRFIAEVIKNMKTLSPADRSIVVGNFGFAFRLNPAFDYKKFRVACGLADDKQED